MYWEVPSVHCEANTLIWITKDVKAKHTNNSKQKMREGKGNCCSTDKLITT